MAIRITQNTINTRFDMDRNAIYTSMAKTQRSINDGLRIHQPSDDPFGTGQVMDFNAQIADVQRFQETIKDARGFLEVEDAALDTVTNALQQIRAKGLQAANGTNGPSDMQSIASEIAQLKEAVRDGLNAKFGDQYVFSGTSTNTQPYPAGSNTYDGNPITMNRRIGQNQSVQMNVSGEAIAGPNGANVLDTIDALVNDIQTGNWLGVLNGIGTIQMSTDQALDVRTQLGASSSRLEILGERLARTEETLTASRSNVRDADTAKSYTKFAQQQQMYEAALAAGTRMMQTSILDFIR